MATPDLLWRLARAYYDAAEKTVPCPSPRARIVPFRRRPDTAHLRVACLPPRSATSSSKPSPRYPRWASAAGNSGVWGLLDPPNAVIDIVCAARSIKGGVPPSILAIPSCMPLCIRFIPGGSEQTSPPIALHPSRSPQSVSVQKIRVGDRCGSL